MAASRIVSALDAIMKVGVIGGVVGGLVYSTCHVVQAGHRGVVFNRLFGEVENVARSDGLQFLVPWVQTMTPYEIRSNAHSLKVKTASMDLQEVRVSIRVLYRPAEERLPQLHLHYGRNFADRILTNLANETLKTVTARYGAEELIQEREKFVAEVEREFHERAKEFHLVVDDVSIINFEYGNEYTRAVERKQVAQQEAERGAYLVEKEKQETLARLIRSEGEAVAARLIDASLKSSGSGMLEIRRLEAAKHIASTLSSSDRVSYIPVTGNSSLLIAA